ncbi:hypothetical protein [Candidatus Avelusimicrobium alvi]|uniref:hypothetical protein n=1 Tax=Candidatus Avelusimicrobium alvi TaxID=3416221 RepID=UPI003D114859
MKPFFIFILCAFLAACSSIIPYKDQNLDYLQGIEKDPAAYRGKVVSFGGEVKGVTEDALRLRLVLKVDAPLYYYATGQGNALSYELLLVSFNKRGMPQMTGIQKGRHVKVLARVSSYETRKNFTGKDIVVLHLIAFAISDRTKNQDFFRPEPPDRQLYESWKKGRLFFEESAQDIIERYPAPAPRALPVVNAAPPLTPPAPAEKPAELQGIVFDAEEPPFILPPDPAPAQAETETITPAPDSAPLTETTRPETASGTQNPTGKQAASAETEAATPAADAPQTAEAAEDTVNTLPPNKPAEETLPAESAALQTQSEPQAAHGAAPSDKTAAAPAAARPEPPAPLAK